MKNLLTGLLLGLFFLAACNNPQSADQAAAAADQPETATTVTTPEETSDEDDGSSKRISPAKKAIGTIGALSIEINYSSPATKGRKIWGGLVPYGEVWRTGANEATTISFSKTAKVEGKNLAAGKYALFTIPGEDKWTVIFNTVAEQWGAYEYDKSKDALRVEVKPRALENPVENLEFTVEDNLVQLSWDKLAVPISVGELPQ
ncbi:MAG: DUF2911 domain-containing protein [Phaeodactylibacter sp.]|nr:DUF2911 domain-containing protein [Phaeodactylibacter sp.]MCB9050170.1 DUF2911 domain-containing protein [Lewinellaceae bacterium]